MPAGNVGVMVPLPAEKVTVVVLKVALSLAGSCRFTVVTVESNR